MKVNKKLFKDEFKLLDEFRLGIMVYDSTNNEIIFQNKAHHNYLEKEGVGESNYYLEQITTHIVNIENHEKYLLIPINNFNYVHLIFKSVEINSIEFQYFIVFPENILETDNYVLNCVKEKEEYYANILDCIQDQIFVINNQGVILHVNKAVINAESKFSELVGRNLKDLVKEGYADEALCFRVIESKKPEGLLFKEAEGYDLLSWGVPHFKDNEIDFIVCTEWDLDKIQYIKSLMEDKNKKAQNYRFANSKNFIDLQVIGDSSIMRKTLEMAIMMARSDAAVLIEGESGVGKEVIMKYIVSNSERANASLVEINCGAIPETLIESELFGYEKGAFTGANLGGSKGLFESAEKGTVFLDEVGELPLMAQAKLLRALQEKEIYRVGGRVPISIDVRVIAATNKNLKTLVEKNLFREDLYYRLNVLPLNVPPLRKRTEDIPAFIEYFMRKYNLKYKRNKKIKTKNYDLFINYSWPGNVRELENILERAFFITRGEEITRFDIMSLLGYQNITDGFNDLGNLNEPKIILKDLVDEYEKNLLESYLPYYKNSRQFSEMLGMDKSTINRKLLKYNLKIK